MCQPWLSQSLYTLKEILAHLLGLQALTAEPGFGFCQQHLEFPSGLPSKHYLGQYYFTAHQSIYLGKPKPTFDIEAKNESNVEK